MDGDRVREYEGKQQQWQTMHAIAAVQEGNTAIAFPCPLAHTALHLDGWRHCQAPDPNRGEQQQQQDIPVPVQGRGP